MRRWTFIALFATVLMPLMGSEIYIKQNSHTDPMTVMGQQQPAQDSTQETWIGDKKFAQHTPEMSFIFDMENERLYWVMHGDKSYVEMKPPYDLSQVLPEQMAQMMEPMMASITVTVTPKGEKKTVGKWECEGYDMAMTIMGMSTNIEIWATTDVPFDWKKVNEDMVSVYRKVQMRLNQSAVDEMQKIQGYWMATETTANMMGMEIRSTTEVVEMAKKDAPASVFTVPEGYTKKDALSMEAMGGRR